MSCLFPKTQTYLHCLSKKKHRFTPALGGGNIQPLFSLRLVSLLSTILPTPVPQRLLSIPKRTPLYHKKIVDANTHYPHTPYPELTPAPQNSPTFFSQNPCQTYPPYVTLKKLHHPDLLAQLGERLGDNTSDC